MAPTESYSDAERAYREGDLTASQRILERLVEQEPTHTDARLLLGYTYYRLGVYGEAEAQFRALLPILESPDLYYGLALTSRDQGRAYLAAFYTDRAYKLAPDRADILRLRESLPAPSDASSLAPYERPERLIMPFYVADGYFRHANGTPIIIRGVNLGLALPGKFPAEFPTERDLYDRWLALIGAMNANVIRVYTALPPVFYQALRDYNLAHSEAPLYLIHGVWTELPEDHNYRGGFRERFLEEAYRVIDLVHGNARVAPRPGHASGLYTADVSPWLLGLILGREWEPYSVKAFNERPGAPRAYRGKHFQVGESSAMEAWLTEVMDRVSLYQLGRYHQQTPLAFTTWPPLDPLEHPGDALYDDVQLDPVKITTTPAFRAGHFASYHAYPYYPDFLLSDPAYSAHPRSAYMAYLEELKAHHGDQPVLISEFGVPSSRGIVRPHPQGYNQGGHSEVGQAEVNVKLFEEIVDSGMAGGIVFSWLDEWFKQHWLFNDLERPKEHIPRWHSVMNPEQNYGLIRFEGKDELPLRADSEQRQTEVVAEGGGATLRAHATPSYLHLLVTGLSQQVVLLELDTHPVPGPEFRVELNPEEGRLLINAAYQLYEDQETRTPSVLDTNAEAHPDPEVGWAPWFTQPYRWRLDEPGRLQPGLDPPRGHNPLADYFIGEEVLHLRLPWTLLGVTDPSAGYVFDGSNLNHTLQIDDIGIHLMAASLTLEGRYRWPRWQQPEYLYRLKPAYYALQRLWREYTWRRD